MSPEPKLAGEPGLLQVVADHAGTERHLYTDAGSLGMPKRIPALEVAK